MTPYDECINNNLNRERKVPEDVIRRMYLSWCPPAYDEGFDDIELVYNYFNTSIDKYTLWNFFKGEVNAKDFNQENIHHKLTLGEHCLRAYEHIAREFRDDLVLQFAALLHDNGKPFCKSHIDSRGNCDSECHYYNHQHCGSYDSLFYTYAHGFVKTDSVKIANLIYYHMKPYTSWKQSKKAMKRDEAQVGEYFFNDIMLLHEADLYAH